MVLPRLSFGSAFSYPYIACAAACVLAAQTADAGFVNPLIPEWRGAAGTEMVGWESFTSASGGPNLPNYPGSGPNAALFNFGSGAILTSSGNIYGFSGALAINAFGGTLGQQTPKEVVLNVSTAGTILGWNTVHLTLSDNWGNALSVAPSYGEIRWEQSMGGQGVAQNLAFAWNIGSLPFNASNWKLSFSSIGPSMSLDAVTLDLNYVPAPSALAVIGVAALGGRRRRA